MVKRNSPYLQYNYYILCLFYLYSFTSRIFVQTSMIASTFLVRTAEYALTEEILIHASAIRDILANNVKQVNNLLISTLQMVGLNIRILVHHNYVGN